MDRLHIWRTGISYPLQKEKIYKAHWTNLYFSVLPQPPKSDIPYCDVRKGLPFADQSFDALYAFHIIEHLTLEEGAAFLKEIYRVLKPGGICRLSTPNLKNIAENYLKQLKACLENPTEENKIRYHWAQLEFYDQMVRLKSGGAIYDAIMRNEMDPAYTFDRYGDVFKEFHSGKAKIIQQQLEQQRAQTKTDKPLNLPSLLKQKIRNRIYAHRRRKKERAINGDPRKTLEINKWTYDLLFLRLAFEKAGFKQWDVVDHKRSNIPDWNKFNLDQSNDGDHPIEPSLYMEAFK